MPVLHAQLPTTLLLLPYVSYLPCYPSLHILAPRPLPSSQCSQVLRPSEKFKFNFDWDSKDDTSRDLNPLYNNLHGEAWAGWEVLACSEGCTACTRPPSDTCNMRNGCTGACCCCVSVCAEAALMFGRGMRAGIDRREQKKIAAALETEILRKVGAGVLLG